MIDPNFLVMHPGFNESVHDLCPSFSFMMRAALGNVKYRLRVADNPNLTGAVEFSQIDNPIVPRFLNHYDGPHGETTFTDSSPYHLPLTNTYVMYKDTAVKKIGTAASHAIPGDKLITPFNSNLSFGASTPFTIETWARALAYNPAVHHRLYEHMDVNDGMQINLSPGTPYLQPELFIRAGGVTKIQIISTVLTANNVWRHIAVTRDTDVNKTIRFFVDGNLIGSAPGNFSFDPSGVTASYFCSNDSVLQLYMDETRILNGVCRWNAPFTPILTEYDNGSLPLGVLSEWSKPYYDSMEHVTFVPPYSKLIPPGNYFWQVDAYDADYQDYVIASSLVYPFSITEAAYKWKIGLLGSEVEFIPSNNTVKTEIKKYGRTNIEKRKFTVNFADMDAAKRNALYAEFARATVLNFLDNMGGSYTVYWGDCDRTLNGTAYQPDKPLFGIDRSNMIAGALRWSGTSVFTEV